MTDQKEILACALQQFQTSGLKFTMDDIAKEMHIAKKTIYAFYPSKEQILLELLETGFTNIQKKKQEILSSNLSYEEKLSQVMITLPDQYDVIDFRMLSDLKEKYPRVYEKLNEHLQKDWEPIRKLLQEGKENNRLRPFDVTVFELMMTGGFEIFLSTDTLKENNITYQQALHEMMQIMMKGILNQ